MRDVVADEIMVTSIVVKQGQLQTGDSPFVTSFEGRGTLQGVRFHALTETSALEPEPLCQRVLTAFQRSLSSQGRGSLTSALSRALQASHLDLQMANEKEPMASRVGAGLTCLALRGAEVYMARAGPGVVYLRDAHGVQTLEPPSSTDAPKADTGEGPLLLGMAAGEIPVLLDRYLLQPEQALLVANSALVTAVSYDGLVAILSSPRQEVTGRLRLLMQEDPIFAALLVTPP